MWAGFRVCSPFPTAPPASLPAFRPVWQRRPTTPAPRLQKPCLQLLRECQPVRAFPLVGRTHCHTATLSLLAKFLSCFALLSFYLFFPSFSHSASFMALFSAGTTLFVSSRCSLAQVPSIVSFFPSSFSIWLIFHELAVSFFSCFVTHTHTGTEVINVGFTVTQCEIVDTFVFLFACMLQSAVRNVDVALSMYLTRPHRPVT